MNYDAQIEEINAQIAEIEKEREVYRKAKKGGAKACSVKIKALEEDRKQIKTQQLAEEMCDTLKVKDDLIDYPHTPFNPDAESPKEGFLVDLTKPELAPNKHYSILYSSNEDGELSSYMIQEYEPEKPTFWQRVKSFFFG